MRLLNRLSIFGSLLLFLLFTSFTTGNKAPKYQIKTIVIDAGHGGHDSGCLGSSSQEKHVALKVSLLLGELIQKKFPDIKVIYTRKTDVFVELHERAAIANRNKADLFICIHCNSGPSAAFGAETFVMGLHKSADNLSVAKRENSSILLEKDYQTNYDGFDPNSPEANIIFSLYQNTFINQSLHFASLVQDQFEKNAGRYNRGVKQAGFLVLFRTTMPSVLIELGFLTNKSDERYLNSEKGQDQLTNAIVNAFADYKSATEKKAGSNYVDDTPEEIEVKAKPVADKKKPDNDKKSVIADNQPNSIGHTNSVKGKVFYTIQIGAVANSAKADESKFDKLPQVRKLIGDDGMTRFYSGVFENIDETRNSLTKLKQEGFSDAFICAFSGAKRISVAEAANMLKSK